LEKIGVVKIIRDFLKDMLNIRNGFDHAWTSKVMDNNIKEKGNIYMINLKEVIEVLVYNNII